MILHCCDTTQTGTFDSPYSQEGMIEMSYTSVFERIRQHCREREWFGPDMLAPGRYYQPDMYDIRSTAGFRYPPATEEQLTATERMLGIALPGTLRMLYAEVANGGFGPGYGIIGVSGGAPHPGGWYNDLADDYLSRPPNVRLVDFAKLDAAQKPGKWFDLQYDEESDDLENRWYEWPANLLSFCYWGCNTEHAIHAYTGQIYVIDSVSACAYWAPSLEVWLEQWLDGTLKQQ